MRIGNKQLREVASIKAELENNFNKTLTEKERAIIQRAKRYFELQEQFYQNTTSLERDEL